MNEKQIRLDERLRVYKESPNCNATWNDLASLAELLLDSKENKKEIGFKK